MDERLHAMSQEVLATRTSLREVGAERELLRSRLEESRQETEALLLSLTMVLTVLSIWHNFETF